MKYHFKVTKEGTGYSAQCVELEGCITQGDTIAELETNMKEALNLHLAEAEDSKVVFDLPKARTHKSWVAVEVDPRVALALLFRQARLSRKMTQKAMQGFLGLKNLSNYQRLEDPKRANPEFGTIIELVKKLPELDFAAVINSYRHS